MANRFIIRTGATVPTADILLENELGYNSATKELYIGQNGAAPHKLVSSEENLVTLIENTTAPISETLDATQTLVEETRFVAERANQNAETAQTSADNAQAEVDVLQNFAVSLQTRLIQTEGDLDAVQTTQNDLTERVKTLETGIHINGAEIGIYTEGSSYKSILNNDSWVLSENGSPVITCAETKLTAPRVQVTDALTIGITAWKPGTDKHLRLLKYGR